MVPLKPVIKSLLSIWSKADTGRDKITYSDVMLSLDTSNVTNYLIKTYDKLFVDFILSQVN